MSGPWAGLPIQALYLRQHLVDGDQEQANIASSVSDA